MQGRRLGNWLKQRQDATLDYTEPEEGEADAPGTEWQVDPEIVREQRLRRLRWTIIAAVVLLLVVSGTWLVVRRATAYQRLVRDTFSRNIEYVEYQPFAGAAFIKVDDPSIYASLRDWFAESTPQGNRMRFAPPTCQLRVVFADGSTKVFMIDPTGPSLGPDDTVVPPMNFIPIEVDGFKRYAPAQSFHIYVYDRLPADRKLAKSALPATVTVPGGRMVMTATGFAQPGESRVSPYDMAMETAKRFADGEMPAQALLALKEAQRWMPESVEAQEMAAVARTQIRYQAPRLRDRVAAIVGESDAPFNNRASYHQVRSDLMAAAWMLPPEDPQIRRLRERLASRRPAADVTKFREVRRLDGDATDLSTIRTLLWSPDGTRIAAACSDAFVRMWDATSGRILHRIPAESVQTLAFSADGRYLLAGAGRAWDVRTCDPAKLETDPPVAIAPVVQSDGIVATSNEFGEVQLRDAKTQEALYTLAAHAGPVRVTQFSPDGDALLTFADDKTAIIWDDGPPDGSAPLDDNRFRAMRRLATLPGPGVFGPDGTILLVQRDGSTPAAPPSLPLMPVALKDVPREMQLLAGGKLLFVKTESGEGVVIDAQDGTERNRFKPTAPGGAIAVSPDGTHVAYGNSDGSVRVVETATGNEVRILRTTTAAQKWSTLQYGGDGRLLLARDGESCSVWDVNNGTNWFHIDRLSTIDPDAIPATFSADGKHFAVARTRDVFDIITTDTFDATVRVPRPAVTSFAFSRDGRLLAAADVQGTVTIHDASSGAALQTIPVPRTEQPGKAAQRVRAMLFSPDGNTLLVDPADNSLRLIDVTAGTELRRLPWPEKLGRPHPLSFSPDSQRVLTGTILWGTPE